VRRVGTDASVEQDYFRKRASAHTIVEKGQQHIAMEDRKFIASTLSYSGQLRDSLVMHPPGRDSSGSWPSRVASGFWTRELPSIAKREIHRSSRLRPRHCDV